MLKVLLLGYPLTTSWSPVMQQAAFLASGIVASYELCNVEPENFDGTVESLRETLVLGANVTMPYKQRVISLLDHVDEATMGIGAVNTIVHQRGRLLGYNTDVFGAEHTLATLKSQGKRVVLLGAGGAARAVLAALGEPELQPANVTVINRSLHRLQELAPWLEKLPYRTAFTAGEDSGEMTQALRNADLVVNTTTEGQLWWQEAITCPVWDLNYGHKAHGLMQFCKAKGLPFTDGRQMLIAQAQKAFELWTGQSLPMTVFSNALGGAHEA